MSLKWFVVKPPVHLIGTKVSYIPLETGCRSLREKRSIGRCTYFVVHKKYSGNCTQLHCAVKLSTTVVVVSLYTFNESCCSFKLQSTPVKKLVSFCCSFTVVCSCAHFNLAAGWAPNNRGRRLRVTFDFG